MTDSYHDTYTGPEPVDEFLCDVNVKASAPIFKELLSPSGSGPQYARHGIFLRTCQGRSNATVGLYHVAPRIAKN